MKKVVYFLLAILPLLVSFIIYPTLPDRVPLHYGWNHQVDRWGSRSEIFIFPIVVLLMALVVLVLTKIIEKKEHGEKNQKISILLGIWMLVFMDILFVFMLYTISKGVVDLSRVPFAKIVFGGLGILLICMGNIMPKVGKNHMMGIRTKWSLYSDSTWKKSQRAGGITSILVGILILLLSLFSPMNVALLGSVCLLVVFLLAILLESYLIYKKYINS